MSRVFSIITVLSLCFYYSVYNVNSPIPAKKTWDVNTHIVFYRVPDQKQLADIKKFDLAIVEPDAISDIQLKELQEAGVLVVGYVPITSISRQWSPYTGLQDEDYLYIQGQKVENDTNVFQDWVMDPRSNHYCEIVLKDVRKVYARGFNGVFMDTVAEATDFSAKLGFSEQAEVLKSTVNLIRDIREMDRNKILIQNGGWWGKEPFTVLNWTAYYIDFLYWENFDLHKNDYWINKLEEVKKISRQYNFKVLVSSFFYPKDYNGVEEFYSCANTHGFIPYAPWTTNGLHTYASVNIYKMSE